MNKVKSQPRSAFLLSILLIVALSVKVYPILAEPLLGDDQEKAEVMLDGKFLFKVGSIENFTAEERAELINSTLNQEVNKSPLIKLDISRENEQTVIRNVVNNRHILNVTESDVISGTSSLEQARVWRDILQENLIQGKQERTFSYRLSQTFWMIFWIIIGIGSTIFICLFKRDSGQKLQGLLTNRHSLIYNLDTPLKILGNLAFFLIQISIWGGLLYYSSEVFPFIRRWRYQIYQTLDSKIFRLGESNYSAIDLLLLLILTASLLFFIRLVTILFRHYILSQTGASQGLQDILTTIIQYLLSFLSVIILWQIWGFDVSSLALIVSVLGVGIGFGLQNIANNFISGLILTIERPIQIGDLIKVGDLLGKVKKIGSRSTVIQTLDKVSIIVPNSHFLENDVINWNYEDPVSRLRIPIGVAYGSNLKKVRLALLEAVKKQSDVRLVPRPQVWFEGFGDSSLNFEVLVWISDPEKQFQIKSELNYYIAASLSHYEIEIPFPQRNLHFHSPQLQQMLELWLRKQGITLSQTAKSPPPETENLPEVPEQFWADIEDKLSNQEIEDIVKNIRSQQGIEIKDCRYRLNTYSNCFVGQELVTWLTKNSGYTREQAIELGQILIEKKVIHHVTDQHNFSDDYLFYRFYIDE